jgi:predicted DCC family thiol-disulfide oxidoreductase YuxK
MEEQRPLLHLEFLAAGGVHARTRFPNLDSSTTPEELVVVDDEGGVYRGSEAWILCLYALEDYREWSYRLASPKLRPLARAAFAWVSTNRHALSRWMRSAAEPELAAFLAPQPEPPCEGEGACGPRGGRS